ncbi:NAD(P)-dependent oxidoreductase [Thalassotalea sp. ND16A]|uniref:NAD(P)-dependent oxidoreductase n=1 Tax=Thalassotalea sp. ND16A TaxID=1535422 RepID=UPI00051D9955|nr:NAD(P)-dependent oxidoreductase [Thalassotalea sp. ND16A]KGJ88073.1 Precorrin-2 dehydrogenase, Uroporphyrinogen-III C-methyltransferase [Thalassotalea sp. ND16A]
MNYFPIFLDAKMISVLVVGGGEIAGAKIDLLIKSPAKVTVVSPKVSANIQALIDDDKIAYIDGVYEKSQLAGKQLVFVATENRSLNEQVNLDARECGVLANVVDNADLCHFITPAIIDRSPMVFAMVSSGQSPVLLRYWREKLETMIPQSLGKLASFAGAKRQAVKDHFSNFANRRLFWESFFTHTGIEQGKDLESTFNAQLANSKDEAKNQGELLLIDAPAHPDLLTLGAVRNMQKADNILHDANVAANIIDLCRRDAPKAINNDSNIAETLALLQQGKRVCYLHLGDVAAAHPLLTAAEDKNYPIYRFNCARR